MQFIAKACQKNYHLTSILFTFYLSHNNLEELKEEAINFTFEEKYFFANLQIFEIFCCVARMIQMMSVRQATSALLSLFKNSKKISVFRKMHRDNITDRNYK